MGLPNAVASVSSTTVEAARGVSDGNLLAHFDHPKASRIVADRRTRARHLFLKRAMSS